MGDIACVIYAAKSTADIRGSLATQLSDCRVAIEALGGRKVLAEHVDERISGFSRSRGPSLEAAMSDAARAAAPTGMSELWVQHSDRLARGDGRRARHAVEIALWAMKANVAVRPVEDPETFRDLLSAVVTGERNHEDSKRKGTAVAAGLRRAACRGDYGGDVADGYRVRVEVDDRGQISRQLVIDEERRGAFELIFALELKRKTPAQIVAALTAAGWRTAPRRRDQDEKPFTHARIRQVLRNPRYAGLAVNRGEIVGQGRWPAYISEREFERIQRRLRKRARGPNTRPREPYLLRGLARCGECGALLHIVSGKTRRDGTCSRRYHCPRRERHSRGVWIDAEVLDHVFIASIGTFLDIQRSRADAIAAVSSPLSRAAPRRDELISRIRQAFIEGRDAEAEALLGALTNTAPATVAPPTPQTQLVDRRALVDLQAWSSAELAGGSPRSSSAVAGLRQVVERWFQAVTVISAGCQLLIHAIGRDGRVSPAVTVDIGAWKGSLRDAGFPRRRFDRWSDSEILHALRTWADRYGRAPFQPEWDAARTQPNSAIAMARFGTWNDALRMAGLEPTPRAFAHRHRRNLTTVRG